jgi:hypothetical protein
MPIPLIFIHYGNSDALFYAIWQAKKTNPDSRVILLGDHWNRHYGWLLGIEHHFIQDYKYEAKQALENYIHLSTNGEKFERFCIERWFTLYEFIAAHKELQPCVYLDSDVLIYDVLDLPAHDFSSFGMTMVAYSAHTNFIRSSKDLSEFCNFIRIHYEKPSLRKWLHEHYSFFLETEGEGGISDMTFFRKFRQENLDKVGLLYKPTQNQTTFYAFDERIDTDYENYEMVSGIKNLSWDNGFPECIHQETGKKIKFYSLHFQGENKKNMKKYISTKSVLFLATNNIGRILNLRNKIINFLINH